MLLLLLLRLLLLGLLLAVGLRAAWYGQRRRRRRHVYERRERFVTWRRLWVLVLVDVLRRVPLDDGQRVAPELRRGGALIGRGVRVRVRVHVLRRVALDDGHGVPAELRRRGALALPARAAVHLLRRDEVRHDDLTLLQSVRVARVA